VSSSEVARRVLLKSAKERLHKRNCCAADPAFRGIVQLDNSSVQVDTGEQTF
jgi:hypothetical protein